MGSGYTTGAESVRFGVANTYGMVNITYYGISIITAFLSVLYLCVRTWNISQ